MEIIEYMFNFHERNIYYCQFYTHCIRRNCFEKNVVILHFSDVDNDAAGKLIGFIKMAPINTEEVFLMNFTPPAQVYQVIYHNPWS